MTLIFSFLSQKAKATRRLSARVTDFFKPKPKAEVATPAKVDENPPKIEEPTPVAPLEDVTEDIAPAIAAVEVPAETVIAEQPTAPVVAAAA